jgi:hypothetical protein
MYICISTKQNYNFKLILWYLKGRHHLGNLHIDGRIILKWILKKQDESMDWIHLAEPDWKQWRLL